MRLFIFSSTMVFAVMVSLFRPFFGLLVFTWLGYFRPQNFVWASGGERFSYFVAIAILLGCFFNLRKEKIFIFARENFLMILLLLAFGYSTLFSVWPGNSYEKIVQMVKIFLIAVLTGSLTNSKKRFRQICWVIVFSLGFFAVKGAIFKMLHGGRLSGPSDSMIADNNDFALAINMVLPFFLYMGYSAKTRWKKNLFYLMFIFAILAVIYTYSRGGFLGLCAVLLMLILRSRKKLLGIAAMSLGVILFLNFGPQAYLERIKSIKTYEKDESAMGRIYAWRVAMAMIKERPLTGVGLRNFIQMYPFYDPVHGAKVAHNSYLQLAAETGLVSLSLFLLLLTSAIFKLKKIRRKIKFSLSTSWIHNYSRMIEIGLMGYMVSAFFLTRYDFDLLYQFVGLTVALEAIAKIPAKTLKTCKNKEN